MDNPGLQPSITPPPAPPLVPPPVPPINEPPKENPIIQPPPNQTVKKAKKFLPKLAVGTLMVALLVGGLFLGKNLLQEKQRPVEKKAADCTYNCGAVCIDAVMCPNPNYDATCTDNDCPSGYATCSCEPNGGGGGGGGGGGEICNNESPTVTDCRGQAVGYEFCFQNTANMYCSKISLVGGNIWNCGQDFGGNACGGGGGNPTSGTCGNGNPFNNQCVVIYCPNGDTNGDGACEVPDQGAWYGQRHTCGTVSFGANECGQIDPVDDNGAYCQLDGWSYTIKLNNCSGTPLQSPEPSPSASPSPSPSPSASPSPSPSPSASPTLACVDLTKNKTAPTLGDKVIFTCEATFSAPHPVAQFRWKVDEGEWIIEEPDNQMDPITHKASTEGDIYKVGVWTWQCRVCMDSTKTTCTTWGQAQ